MAEGIEVRVGRDRRKSYRASVWSNREQKRIRKTFPSLAAAKTWRTDALSAINKGTMRAPTRKTVGDAFSEFLEGAKSGAARNRSGDRYKPAAIRAYERAFKLRIAPELAACRLSDVQRRDVQDIVDQWVADRLAPATINVTLAALGVVYRRAMNRGDVAVNPATGIEKPAARGRRERIADPEEAAKLIAALPETERAVWATAMYAGLRRGELMALDCAQVDLASGVICVEHGWDPKSGLIELKSHAGRRKVPVAAVLRDHLVEHRLTTARSEGLVFGSSQVRPFHPTVLTDRADKAWKEAGLNRITLHECRHTFASLMIAAGVNAKALSTYMGHANISMTLDRYGHLMPGNEADAAELLDAYLQDQRARAADPMGQKWDREGLVQRAETG
jgi:integrase